MARPPDRNAKVKLLAAAENVFVARGLEDAKVEEIARRAGLGKGSFYLHFASKEDAFRQLVEATLARMATYLDGVSDDCPADLADVGAFVDFWVNKDAQIFEFIWQNRGLMGLMLGGGHCAAYRHLIDEFAESARLKMTAFLTHGIEAGLYRPDLDVEVASAFIAGAYDRLARQIVAAEKRPDLHALLRKVQLLVLRGIGSVALVAALEPSRQSAALERNQPRRKAAR